MKRWNLESVSDDARLTAYALGELEGEERSAVEHRLATDAEARAFVEGVRATAGELVTALALPTDEEGATTLSAEHRAAVERAALAPTPARKRPRLRRRERLALLTAVGALGVVGAWWSLPTGRVEELLARTQAPPASGSSAGRLRGLGYLGDSSTPPAGSATHTLDRNASVDRSYYTWRETSVVGGSHAKGEVEWRPVGQIPIHGEWVVAGDHLHDPTIDQAESSAEEIAPVDREGYERIHENPFLLAAEAPLSTFSIDVDTASYANVRRMLEAGQLPPADAVRIEELVNYFPYSYPAPRDGAPFAVSVEVGAAPWRPEHRLVRIALSGRPTPAAERAPSNLVFLLDVSGSMNEPQKLPLLVQSLRLLVQGLDGRDHVAIVVYAGASGLVLPSTSGDDAQTILAALESLQAGGSTNGGAGIELAYKVAAEHYVRGGINRVILATDGDFNVGVTSDGELERLIEAEAKGGVFLTVLGFGMGNLQDAKLEKLSGRGNGTYAYIDSLLEARKVLVEELGGTLETIAKDVKIQVDFNPAEVRAYRLIGYEDRLLAAQDFQDDTKDAGEIGAGHTVTALYELVPASGSIGVSVTEPSKYVTPPALSGTAHSGELLTVRLRYKLPDSDTSTPLEVPVIDGRMDFSELSSETRFAAAVASFGMLLRGSEYRGEATYESVRSWALEALGSDPSGYRRAFVELVGRANALQGR